MGASLLETLQLWNQCAFGAIGHPQSNVLRVLFKWKDYQTLKKKLVAFTCDRAEAPDEFL
jgi:hypothetical protein